MGICVTFFPRKSHSQLNNYEFFFCGYTVPCPQTNDIGVVGGEKMTTKLLAEQLVDAESEFVKRWHLAAAAQYIQY